MMKTVALSVMVLCSSMAISSAFAQTAAPVPPANVPPHMQGEHHPCKKIMAACEAAGYYKNGHKANPPKGLFDDCMKPILSGAAVAGVSVDSQEVAACNARREKEGKR